MNARHREKAYLVKLGRRIRQIRKQRGFSQERLGFECGIHRTYISSVERGQRNIAVLNLHKIARALQVPISDLLSE